MLRSRSAIRFGIVFTTIFASCALAIAADTGKSQIRGTNLRVEFDKQMRSRVVARFNNAETVLGPFTNSETLTTTGKVWSGFAITSQKHAPTKDAFGQGEQLIVEGKSGALTKTVTVTVYKDFPAMAFFDVQYTNNGTVALAVKSWTNNAYTMNAQTKAGEPPFWSYQSGSYEKRPNWILPLKVKFQQDNYQGMNADDYGGGTPRRGPNWFRSPLPCPMPPTPASLCASIKKPPWPRGKAFTLFAPSSLFTRATTFVL
jgi:alpha-galactosidase